MPANNPGDLHQVSDRLAYNAMRHWKERLIEAVLLAAAAVSVLTTLGIVWTLLSQSLLFFRQVNPFVFLTGTVWQPQIGEFGVLPLVTDTLITSLIAMLMSVELILNAAALNFVAFHHFLFEGDVGGAVFPVFIIAVAAAEAAIALAIIIALFRHKNQLDVQDADSLKN